MKKIVITGAGGQIGQQLVFKLPLLFREEIEIRLLDLPEVVEKMDWMIMELEDCAFDSLKKVELFSEEKKAFKNADYIICVGAYPRKQGMERSDLLLKNAEIFKKHAESITQVCSLGVKVLVVGNPCNSNLFLLSQFLDEKHHSNLFCLTTLDEMRLKAFLAKHFKVGVSDIHHVFVWGNHSLTQYPDIFQGKIQGEDMFHKLGMDFLQQELLPSIRQRGAKVIQAKGASSSSSAAEAVFKATQYLFFPQKGTFSMGRISQGEYGIEKGLAYSFPCVHLREGEIQVLENLKIDDFSREQMLLSVEELKGEISILKSHQLI